jgi:hypothetical protein
MKLTIFMFIVSGLLTWKTRWHAAICALAPPGVAGMALLLMIIEPQGIDHANIYGLWFVVTFAIIGSIPGTILGAWLRYRKIGLR